ncbi:MAG: hypothetical protein DRG25_04505 [Deltaproteobacteria bacterium]|nr:MAG: hypothetical protein DRG25_04505 [Deltaproteobacteria bacterium]
MLIATPCPQCGGEIEFLEEAQAVKCQYCGSLLQVVGTDGVRKYYLEPKTDEERIKKALMKGLSQKKKLKINCLNSRLIFYPYWWVKGMVFKWFLGKKTIPHKLNGVPDTWENVKELKTHLFDHTFPANGEILLGPLSLGIRTSALRVRAFNQKEIEKWGFPLKETISYEQAKNYVEKQKGKVLKLKNIDIEMEKVGLIGERYSLIFFPIWAFTISSSQGEAEILIDGVSHSVINIPQKEKRPLLLNLREKNFGFSQGDIRFIPYRCPICGWDFNFHPFNIIHLCTTCGRAWRERGGSYKEVPYKVAKGKGDQKKLYLPFWTFRVFLIAPEEKVSTLDKFYHYFPIPRLIKKEKQRQPIKFYIPAFRIKNIPVVNKFSTLFTQHQPQTEYLEKEAILKHDFGDIFLSSKEAKEMAEILLFSLIPKNSRKAKKFVSQAQIRFSREQLEWYPFLEKGIFFREENTGFALQKGAVEVHH